MQNDNEGPRTAEGQAGGRNTEREGKKKKKARPRGTPSANSARGGSSPRVICPSAPPAACPSRRAVQAICGAERALCSSR